MRAAIQSTRRQRPLTRLALTLILLIGTPAWARSADEQAEACFRLKINQARKAVHVDPLTEHPALTMIARTHADRMADAGTIFHNQSLGQQLPPFTVAGENVGMGPDCPTLHEAFMDSEGHRENIEDPDFRQMGVGVEIRDDAMYVVEVFAALKPAAKPRSKPTGKPTDSC